MDKDRVNLIILSPTPEVNKLTFSDIPTTTTIGDLRERIFTAAPSHPAPARQRLIYRGHALIDAKKTLKDIDSSETLSLHLVLPPEPAAQLPTSSTPSNIQTQGQRSRTPLNVHGSSEIGESAQTAQQGQIPRPSTPGSVGRNNTPPPQQVPPPLQPHGHAHTHGHAHGGLPPGHFPPQLQQAFAQFHAVNQQLAAQLAAIGNNPMLQGMPANQAQASQLQQPTLAPVATQPMMTQQQQQANLSGGQQGTPSTSHQHMHASGTPFRENGGAETAPGPAQATAPPSILGNTNRVVRENIGPNVSPSGLYTTPWQIPNIGAIAPHSHIHPVLTPTVSSQLPTHQQVVDRQQSQNNAAQLAQAQQQAQPPIGAAQAVQGQQQQQQQANQARDLARILLPLGGHLWLVIRLFGFVYFFTAGAGWRRTFLLGLVAVLVFVAQTGVFRPMIQGLWDPIRRHAEGLVPLAGNEPPRPAAAAARNDANPTGTQPANRELTPQEAAERLLQERERQNGNLLRQSMRRIERAIALFVASLVPGVGERHIAAREAAEAARQAEVREREERARSEEEEARKQREERAPENTGANESDSALDREAGGSSPAQQQEQAAQPPLVEI
ncbi:hypothetical protein P7C71_g1439, partial [Lecanoromycetidae sp. Uapishka_2]